MRLAWETLLVGLGMFSRVPLKQPTWCERNLQYVLVAFPLVGLLIGLLLWIWAWLCATLAVPDLMRGAGFCLWPILLTGGLHLDGYADVCDAQASCAEPKRKQEILRDPHCGAFAAIRLGIYLMASFALCTSLVPQGQGFIGFGGSFVLSRLLSGLALCSFPIAAESSLARSFAITARRERVRGLLFVLSLVWMALLYLFGHFYGLAVSLVALCCLLYYRRIMQRDFDGTSGDLAGWFLQKAELWMLFAVVFGQVLGDYFA